MKEPSWPGRARPPCLTCLCPPQPPAAPGPGRAGGGGFRKYRFILFKHPWHRQGPQSPERGGERPQVTQHGGPGWAGLGAPRAGTLGLTGYSLQVSDFLSGRSPLTLALRVGDHMMFVQLQLAAQHAPLQHRHVLAAAAAATRGDPSMTTSVSSPCRPVSSAARVPPVPTSPAPASPPPVTAGSFRSHSAPTTCPEVSPGRAYSVNSRMGCSGTWGRRVHRDSDPLFQRPSLDPGLVGDPWTLNPKVFAYTLSSCAPSLISRWTVPLLPVPGPVPHPPLGAAPPPVPENLVPLSRAS